MSSGSAPGHAKIKVNRLTDTAFETLKKRARDANETIRLLGEAALLFLNQSETLPKVSSIVASFEDSHISSNVAGVIANRAQFVCGEAETKVISDLGLCLSQYEQVPLKLEVLDAWGNAAYAGPEGALAVSGAMQQRTVVKIIDRLYKIDPEIANQVVGSLGNIALYLQDNECVEEAANAVQKYSGAPWFLPNRRAIEIIKDLESTANQLSNEPLPSLWTTVTSENKKEFIAVARKGQNELSKLTR